MATNKEIELRIADTYQHLHDGLISKKEFAIRVVPLCRQLQTRRLLAAQVEALDAILRR